jgi:hypothetical protein
MPGNCRPSLRRKTLHNVRLTSGLSNTDKKCIESAFEKLQELDELGVTIEDIRALKEKNTSKKPDYEGDGYDDKGELIYDTMICPNCGKDFEVDYYSGKCCDKCGQMFDRSIENDWS